MIESMFDKSMAFLEVSIISSKEPSSSSHSPSDYLNVTAHLLHHSVELFLKYLVSEKTDGFSNGHNIQSLYIEYKEHYPDERYHIDIPFNEEIEYIGFEGESEIKEHKRDYPMSRELQLRYPVGRKNDKEEYKAYSPNTLYDTEFLEKYKEDILNLRSLILNDDLH